MNSNSVLQVSKEESTALSVHHLASVNARISLAKCSRGDLFFSYRLIEDATSRIEKSQLALERSTDMKQTISNVSFF